MSTPALSITLPRASGEDRITPDIVLTPSDHRFKLVGSSGITRYTLGEFVEAGTDACLFKLAEPHENLCIRLASRRRQRFEIERETNVYEALQRVPPDVDSILRIVECGTYRFDRHRFDPEILCHGLNERRRRRCRDSPPLPDGPFTICNFCRGGDLFMLIDTGDITHCTLADLILCTTKLLEALVCLESLGGNGFNGIYHGDIKLENICLRSRWGSGLPDLRTPVLIDFGGCVPMGHLAGTSTTFYRPPDYNGFGHHKFDVFSLGYAMFLLFGAWFSRRNPDSCASTVFNDFIGKKGMHVGYRRRFIQDFHTHVPSEYSNTVLIPMLAAKTIDRIDAKSALLLLQGVNRTEIQ